jgi:hypothetical protein
VEEKLEQVCVPQLVSPSARLTSLPSPLISHPPPPHSPTPLTPHPLTHQPPSPPTPQVLVIFKFLSDKDIFESYYKKLLVGIGVELHKTHIFIPPLGAKSELLSLFIRLVFLLINFPLWGFIRTYIYISIYLYINLIRTHLIRIPVQEAARGPHRVGRGGAGDDRQVQGGVRVRSGFNKHYSVEREGLIHIIA